MAQRHARNFSLVIGMAQIKLVKPRKGRILALICVVMNEDLVRRKGVSINKDSIDEEECFRL